MSTTDTTPRTVLTDLEPEVLVGLLKAGYTAPQIEAMSDPAVHFFATQHNLDYQELKTVIDALIAASVMEHYRLSVFQEWLFEINLSLPGLLDAANTVGHKLNTVEIKNMSRVEWVYTTFQSYVQGRVDGVSHEDMITGIEKEATPGDYLSLRSIGYAHSKAMTYIELYGANTDAFSYAKDGGVSEHDIELFLQNSSQPDRFRAYLALRIGKHNLNKATHKEAFEVIEQARAWQNFNVVWSYQLFIPILTHREAITLLNEPKITLDLLATNGNEFRRGFGLTADSVVILCQAPRRLQKIVQKVVEAHYAGR